MLQRGSRRGTRIRIWIMMRCCEQGQEDIDEIEYDVAKKSVSSIGWDNLRKKKKLYFLSCFFNIIRKYPTATTRIKQQRRPITQQSTRKLLSSSLFFFRIRIKQKTQGITEAVGIAYGEHVSKITQDYNKNEHDLINE